MALPASITTNDRTLRCEKCGATSEPKNRGRFLTRHPVKCEAAKVEKTERREYAKQLAAGQSLCDRMSGFSGGEWLVEVRDLRNSARGLTKWEEGFLDSIEEQLEEHGRVSERQAEILTKIRREKA
jgi:hypothetical protein